MANKLILKKSSVAAKVPLATDLVAGELAVNLADAKLYTKDGSGNVILVGSGAGGAVSSVAGKTGAVTLVKGDVGLGNVDNTSDASKPVSTAQQTALDLKSNLASPTFTGTPAAPTAAVGTNTTQLATTAYVNAEIANDATPISHVGSGGTQHAAATTAVAGFMSAADKTKLDGVASGATANTGTVTGVTGTAPIVSSGGTAPAISISAATTAAAGSMSAADKTKLDGIASGAQVNTVTSVAGRTGAVTLAVADVSGAAPLAAPTFTGVPAAPTAAVGTNTTQLATTAFVNAEIANDAPSKTGTGASGTWGISITGNAATITNFTTTTTTNVNIENTTSTVGYVTNSLFGVTDGALYSHVYSSVWKHQIQGDYRTGQIAIRGKNNGTWQAWRTVLDSSNYTTYAPTNTGTGASGTWGISITGSSASTTGNAATATLAANSTLAGGLAINTTGTNNVANQIVRTDANGYANFGWINTVSGVATGTPARVYCSQDAYIRYYDMATFTGYVRTAATGSWGISVTGSAGSVPFSGVSSKPTTLSGYGITDALQAGAGGAIIENSQSITANYTLTAGKNGMSAGAITIASGITVTVPAGATWVIV